VMADRKSVAEFLVFLEAEVTQLPGLNALRIVLLPEFQLVFTRVLFLISVKGSVPREPDAFSIVYV
jgi:hypothetical protein